MTCCCFCYAHFLLLLHFLSIIALLGGGVVESSSDADADALLALKRSVDPLNVLQWSPNTNVCNWEGVRQCNHQGRVTKLVIENLNLTGILDQTSLNKLDQLRVLSFKQNLIHGQIPSLSALINLKSLYLNYNNFSGKFPESISLLRRLKVVFLAHNRISGHIPVSLIHLPRLYQLYLEDNSLTGEIPPFNQTSLKFFNVSYNKLSGEIPANNTSLLHFNRTSFLGNIDLCGLTIAKPCKNPYIPGPSISPSYPLQPESTNHHKHNHKRLILILIPSIVGGFLLLIIILGIAVFICKRARRRTETGERKSKGVGATEGGGEAVAGGSGGGGVGGNGGGGGGGGKPGFSWEGQGGGEGVGALVFCGPGDQLMDYSMDDLLKASAETLGRGTMGSTYKAVMESGYIVTVKRLKEANYPRIDEFRRHVDVIGKLRHPNLVPLRAYFQAKEERLLVYDYFPNGSLFSLIHGSRASGGSKPLHWTSCLKIAEDLATGLLYIHQSPGLTHGNLKSSNVLLGADFESCLTDYCLTPFRNPESLEESSASSLFYRSPECRDPRKPPTQQADVYSFGVLLLELLTGKTPFQDLVQEHGSDIPRWVRSIREEETESGEEQPASGNEASEEKLTALLNIAMASVSLAPENRPTTREVLRMIRDARAEAQVSSNNSSDHSPGRWSDTVQSLPRDEHSSI